MPESSAAWTRLSRAACLALAAHLAAGLAMALILRHGLDINPDLTARLRFLVAHRALWILGWLTWNAAALSIIYFYAVFAWAHRADERASVAPLRLAVYLSVAAVAADLSAEAVEMAVLPGLAARVLAQPLYASSFLTVHRIAVLLTGYLANSLYTLTALLLCLWTRRFYPKWVWLAGLGIGVFGLLLSLAALVNSASGMLWSNAGLIPCILAWLAGVALSASRRVRDRTAKISTI